MRASAEFLRVQRGGVRWQTEHFLFYVLRCRESERSRLGITVSRRVGKAVVRNRLKRRVRECFRLKLRQVIGPGMAVVVVARAGAGDLETPTINAELVAATLNLSRKLKA